MRPKGPSLYGRALGRHFGVAEPQTLLLDSDVSSTMAITRVQSEQGTAGWTKLIAHENSFAIPVHLTMPDITDWATSINGSIRTISSWHVGGMGIYDLEQDLRVLRNGAVDVIHFNLPRATLDHFTEDAELPKVSELQCVEGTVDEIIHHLAQMMLPCMAGQQTLPALFLEYFVQVLCSRIVSAYSVGPKSIPVHRGGLAPWQKRRTLELLEQHLAGDLRLGRLAAECGLSSSYFSRCFQKSFGVSVHQFVIQKRVERARELLMQSQFSLVEIAIESGFSDQAALSRTFSGVMGVPPARWKAEHLAKARSTLFPAASSMSVAASVA